MVKFLELNDQLPPCKTISSAFGWSSGNTSFELLQQLEAKGVLARNELGNLMLADRPGASAAENLVRYCPHCGCVAHVVTLMGVDHASSSDRSNTPMEAEHG
jgi:hypothetical protein